MGADTACAPTPAPADARCAHGASPPQRDVTVSGFAVDAYEVTVARFRAFWSAPADQRAAVRAAPIRYPDGTTIDWLGAARLPMRSPPEGEACNWTDAPGTSEREAHPINCADWWTAQEFCVWDGGRLPTEAEWEYAARWRPAGRAMPGRLYPWGDEDPSPACNRAQWNFACGGRGGDDGRGTRRVGSFETGASGGIFDLAGNVDEWTADRDARYGAGTSADPCVGRAMKENPLCVTGAVATSNRVVRGGSYSIPSDQVAWLRSASRGGLGGTALPGATGFRCVRTR